MKRLPPPKCPYCNQYSCREVIEPNKETGIDVTMRVCRQCGYRYPI